MSSLPLPSLPWQKKPEPHDVLLATSGLPPIWGGSAVILHELLRHFPKGSVVGVHGSVHPTNTRLDLSLPIARYQLKYLFSDKWTDRLNRLYPDLLVPYVAQRIDALAKRYQVKRLYAHYPSSVFTVAAYKVAKRRKLPLTLYMDILWQEHSKGRNQKLAAKLEHDVIAYADQRIAITKSAAEYLEQKHGFAFQCIPHTIDATLLPDGPRPAPEGAPTIHFAGSIYPPMNQDSVERMVLATQQAKSKPRVDLCTPATLEGPLDQPNVSKRFLKRDELIAAQRSATILYLPMAFESDKPMMVKSNFPTKAIEYYCSGRPILVHAPADSYLATIARKHNWAYVVDEPDVSALAEGIDQLIGDHALQ
jgi:glycosyltransferase involved in cell wall biosynthesis